MVTRWFSRLWTFKLKYATNIEIFNTNLCAKFQLIRINRSKGTYFKICFFFFFFFFEFPNFSSGSSEAKIAQNLINFFFWHPNELFKRFRSSATLLVEFKQTHKQTANKNMPGNYFCPHFSPQKAKTGEPWYEYFFGIRRQNVVKILIKFLILIPSRKSSYGRVGQVFSYLFTSCGARLWREFC